MWLVVMAPAFRRLFMAGKKAHEIYLFGKISNGGAIE